MGDFKKWGGGILVMGGWYWNGSLIPLYGLWEYTILYAIHPSDVVLKWVLECQTRQGIACPKKMSNNSKNTRAVTEIF